MFFSLLVPLSTWLMFLSFWITFCFPFFRLYNDPAVYRKVNFETSEWLYRPKLATMFLVENSRCLTASLICCLILFLLRIIGSLPFHRRVANASFCFQYSANIRIKKYKWRLKMLINYNIFGNFGIKACKQSSVRIMPTSIWIL